jgi:hypothetical protein
VKARSIQSGNAVVVMLANAGIQSAIGSPDFRFRGNDNTAWRRAFAGVATYFRTT